VLSQPELCTLQNSEAQGITPTVKPTVITEGGSIVLMKEETSGLAMITLKLKRENY